ncbi:MAG: preprotein translocase subunit SecA [Clostridia bacterium]|nr:preprotein translocase subunit SecA [Clostridia bacterium]
MGILSKIFASENTRNVNRLEKIACKIEALDKSYSEKSDLELMKMTKILKDKLSEGETLDDILPDAFATVREASKRVLNMKPFHVQLLGGICLHQGRIAEMRTGEGKTLVATLPTYLNALSGKGVHVVTVNEYLAKRDAEWMGKIYKFLGLSVGVIVSNMEPQAKKDAYNCDITYCTNNEIGFDYLRDNMVQSQSEKVQRGQNFVIVDEVDSVLIDEARTPLIISGKGMKSSEMYYTAQRFAKHLIAEDYEIDEKLKQIRLTETGIAKAESFFKVENLSDINNIELNHHINNSIKANFIMKRDDNYIVKDDEIIIVDEFTGRLMPGRRYNEGLHQAIEAKENVKINDESKTLATITFQNYFRLYNKLSGMTGTALTEEAEFNGIYNLDVVCIPTNLPIIRNDHNTIIYTTEDGKFRAVVNEIKKIHETGRPILVGTATVEKSEKLSELLRREKIRHSVLNAKNHEQESEIVAQAGKKGSLTIATNMAGRGTDILLGGNPEFLTKKALREKGYNQNEIELVSSYTTTLSEEMRKLKDVYNETYRSFKQETDKEKVEVVALGGLCIIGTERHESRRIDNQLRGRAGRQGDPGSSVFYVSMEDDLIRRFGGDRMKSIAQMFKIDDDTPFQIKILSKQIENAQRKIEAQNYASRKFILEYDDVMSKQREIIYGERDKVLSGADVHQEILDMFPNVVRKVVYNCISDDKPFFDWDLENLNKELERRLFEKGSNVVTEKFVEECEVEDVYKKVYELVILRYENLVKHASEINFNFAKLERDFLLRVVDVLWMGHIDTMEILKKEIGLQAYGGHNPLVEYKREGFDLFDEMVEKIREDTCTYLLNFPLDKITLIKKPDRPMQMQTNQKFVQAKSSKVVGRNDPCPCGSGKKYKHCCGKN